MNASNLQLYSKRDSGAGAFLWICKISKITYVVELLWTTVSENRFTENILNTAKGYVTAWSNSGKASGYNMEGCYIFEQLMESYKKNYVENCKANGETSCSKLFWG